MIHLFGILSENIAKGTISLVELKLAVTDIVIVHLTQNLQKGFFRFHSQADHHRGSYISEASSLPR